MNKEEAKKRIEELKSQGKTVFDLTFESECIEFFQEEIQEIQLTNDDFHWKESWPSKNMEIVDYKKQFIMLIGAAAGITVMDIVHSKESMFVHNATCYVRRPTPNGTNQELSADSCYDVEARFQIELSNDIIKYEKWKESGSKGDQQGGKYCTKNEILNEALKRKRMAEMAQHGAAQADTGAHQRAIKKMLKIPPATEKKGNGYLMPGSYIFISCIKPNLQNTELRTRFLNSYFGGATGKQILFEKQEQLQIDENKAGTNTDTIQGTVEDVPEGISDYFGFDDFQPIQNLEKQEEVKNYFDLLKKAAINVKSKNPDTFAIVNNTAIDIINSQKIEDAKKATELIESFMSSQSGEERALLFIKLIRYNHVIIRSNTMLSVINEFLTEKHTKKEVEEQLSGIIDFIKKGDKK